MNQAVMVCESEQRRRRVRQAEGLFGLDYVEVNYDTVTGLPALTVFFLGRAPENFGAENLRLEGGTRIRDIQITDCTVNAARNSSFDDSMVVTVDKDGDFSTYRLCVVEPAEQGDRAAQSTSDFDPRYRCVEFSFKAGCPSDLDCKNPAACPPPQRVEPDINYLAKDYAGFRQLILDRLALLMPGWQERHVPDLGITLVELLAYVGDYLSYYQDAVATEAYLDTARRRISVRRHARLVDYRLHEGCNARAWLTVWTDVDVPAPLEGVYFSTESDDGNAEIFEPLMKVQPLAAHSEIKFYTWQDRLCCLPKGCTRATLQDAWTDASATPVNEQAPAQKIAVTASASSPRPRALKLQPGDFLIFEEMKGPKTGNPADADASRRWVVRLTRVTPAEDPLKTKDGQTVPVVEIEWADGDALPFPFCLSTRLPAPDCRIICDISVARGNVVLVDHGQTVTPPDDSWQVGLESQTGTCECEGSAVDMTSTPCLFRPSLKQSPVTSCEPIGTERPASKMLLQDPRKSLPQVSLTGVPGVCPDPGDAGPPKPQPGVDSNATQWTWLPLGDLLESGADDQNFVVEVDDDGIAHLRFGDGSLGRIPDACMIFTAKYRIGNGVAGNVGADTVTEILFGKSSLSGANLKPRNPLPACGGTDPEPIEEARLFAPGAFKEILERAITAGDYAVLAERNRSIQGAHALLRWTGSWYEVQVAVDPAGSETADDGLLQKIDSGLHRYRRVGHDLMVEAAQYVPLDIEISICVLSEYLRGHVEAALLEVLGNRVFGDGRLGFFHPNNLTFGADIYLSKLIAACQAVTGVKSVTVQKFQRLFQPPAGEIAAGVLALGGMEIAQLDNDPSFPEHGVLKLNLRGGR